MPIHATPAGWVIETATTAYALGQNLAGLLCHRYWGPRLPHPDAYPPAPNPGPWGFNDPDHLTPEEYPAHGGIKFNEPCLKVTFADGVRDLVLQFVSAELSGETLIITLRDQIYPLRVELHYRAHPAYDLIERWAVLHNEGSEAITLERVWSALWHLPHAGDYRLSHLSGRYNDESNLRREPLVQGVKILESRRGTSSQHHYPWFAVDHGYASEELGAVWFGVLAWSGVWKLAAEVNDFGSTRIGFGLNDWDFAWQLKGGSSFATPASLAGFSAHGFGHASRLLHRYIRNELLPHGNAIHKVLYNSWEATEFAVDEQSQARLAELAAAMGIELFVMDDGWFHGRNSDRAGLGDWWPDETKFPNGLGGLIKRVHELGMEFGLWIEPEMVNPDSDLYRQHPDWVIHFPTRRRSTSRNQLVLNLARADVQAYLFERIDKLLSEYPISFIKWDMNRHFSEPGWPTAPGDQRELWVRYVEGLYWLWGSLRERHPQVIWQSCSGGGGRADLGILRFADQIWLSDNTEPTKRLLIQEGYSQIFPANTMEAWVTDMGPSYLPLSFRFHVSMAGSLGIGGHLERWTPAMRSEASEYIAHYKAIRALVQFGDLYRLRSPHAHNFSALQYVNADQSAAVLFVFRTHLPAPAILPPIYLRGLDPHATYQVEGCPSPLNGASLMHAGLHIEVPDFGSTIRKITKLESGHSQ